MSAPILIFESLYAEIERLKNIVRATEVERDAADKICETLREENAHFAWRDKDKDKLITELADALAGMKPISSSSPITSELEKEKLIHRAREATR